MNKEVLENYIFEYIVEKCIDLELYNSEDLDELYSFLNSDTDNKICLYCSKDYVSGYIEVKNRYYSDFPEKEINMYVCEKDIRFAAIKIIREEKLKKLFKNGISRGI